MKILMNPPQKNLPPPSVEERIGALEKELAELRRIHDTRSDLSGPQHAEDSHTEACWQGNALTTSGNGSIRLPVKRESCNSSHP